MRGVARLAATVLGLASLASGSEARQAPDGKPTLVLETGGHMAVVIRVLDTPDGKHLLSAGLDKVVHVWEVHDQWLRLDRSIRPMIRNATGVIYAMELSPKPVDQGQRVVEDLAPSPRAATHDDQVLGGEDRTGGGRAQLLAAGDHLAVDAGPAAPRREDLRLDEGRAVGVVDLRPRGAPLLASLLARSRIRLWRATLGRVVRRLRHTGQHLCCDGRRRRALGSGAAPRFPV